MIAKVRAGLAVRGVFEGLNAGGSRADFNRLKQGSVDVLEDGSYYILHHICRWHLIADHLPMGEAVAQGYR